MVNTCFSVNLEPRNPYENLAIEEALFSTMEKTEAALFLWQNPMAVVIGRNQNCWNECRVDDLQNDGGILARRSTGGGAVYHDKGNLNFSLLFGSTAFVGDDTKNLCFSIVLDAVRSFGIEAELTGRNDLLCGGKKFSGSAFLEAEGKYLHHGTILLSSDLDALEKYLTPPLSKTAAHGVASVRSRVCNLVDSNPHLSVESFRHALIASFSKALSLSVTDNTEMILANHTIEERKNRIADPAWVYDRITPWPFSANTTFSWGRVELKIRHDSTHISDAKLYSDSLDPLLSTRICAACIGATLSPLSLFTRLMHAGEDLQTKDIAAWVHTLTFEDTSV